MGRSIARQLFLLIALIIPLSSAVVCTAGKCFCANGYDGCACGDERCCMRVMGITPPDESNQRGYSSGNASQQQREAETAERARQAEAHRKQIEVERKVKFISDRDAAAKTLKGTSDLTAVELKGVSDTDSYGLKGAESRVGRELKSVEGDSRDAASRDKEASSDKARGGFDRGGGDRGTLVMPKMSGEKPVSQSSLAAQIDPKALKDPNVQKSLAVYEHFEKAQAEIRQNIAETRQKQISGAGDNAVLDAHLKALEYRDKDMENQKTKAKEEVKKTVVNRGFVWNEVEAPMASGRQRDKK